MKLELIIFILITHWIADFVTQSHYESINKSKSFNVLLMHTVSYSIFFVLAGLLWILFREIYAQLILKQNGGVYNGWMIMFIPITFITHTAIDYYTSRVNTKLWEEKKVHEFFVSVGFDQLLHVSQLLLTYYYLNRL